MTESWAETTLDGDADRIVLVLPGRGYTVRRPVLRYPVRALAQDGWTVRHLEWTGGSRPTDDVAQEVYGGLVRELSEAPTPFVLAKSLGSLALPTAAELGVPGCWLTPLLREPDVVAAAMAAAARGTPTLLVGGSADVLWSAAAARAVATRGGVVLDVDGADHSLEVDGDVDATLAALVNVVAHVRRFARVFSRGDGRRAS